jgi:HEAT repeat protein
VVGTSAAQTPLSKRAEYLLGILENPKSDYQERRTAARDLGKLKEKAALDRLLRLLPGDFDALSGDVILALGDIGDPRALPKLDEIYAKADLGSKLSTALYHTREILRQKEKEAKKENPPST